MRLFIKKKITQNKETSKAAPISVDEVIQLIKDVDSNNDANFDKAAFKKKYGAGILVDIKKDGNYEINKAKKDKVESEMADLGYMGKVIAGPSLISVYNNSLTRTSLAAQFKSAMNDAVNNAAKDFYSANNNPNGLFKKVSDDRKIALFDEFKTKRGSLVADLKGYLSGLSSW